LHLLTEKRRHCEPGIIKFSCCAGAENPATGMVVAAESGFALAREPLQYGTLPAA